MTIHKCFIDNGGKRREAFRPSDTHPFAVFQDDAGNWKAAQLVTGMVVMSLVPQNVRRDRKGLLAYLERMETECGEALAMMWCVTEYPIPEDFRPFAQQLIDWAQAQR